MNADTPSADLPSNSACRVAEGRKPLVSIVVPVLNEESNIDTLLETLDRTLAPVTDRYQFEYVFTDNHSTDRTFALLHQRARADHRIRVYRFSRNVGFQKSILTGYLKAKGDAVVQVDADLQDPPALILEFLKQWEQGYHVVYGVRRQRKEGWLITKLRGVFYYLVDKLSEHPLPRQAGDFRLVARPVIEAIRTMDGTFPYLRGVIAGLGFNQTGIVYDREERKRGQSKFPFRALIALAIDGILATSIVPLRLAVYTGLAASFVSLLMSLYYFGAALIIGRGWPSGFATLVILLTFSIGMNSLFLGIIGEYLGRLYEQSKRRPLSLVEYSIEEGRLRNHAPPPYGDATSWVVGPADEVKAAGDLNKDELRAQNK
jgi:dolichol-phosphate mannosyltransferase